jgi:hypothetical protein
MTRVGVEGDMRPAWAVVTWSRLLVVQTMTELNEHLGHADHGDNDRHIGNRRYQQSRSIPHRC